MRKIDGRLGCGLHSGGVDRRAVDDEALVERLCRIGFIIAGLDDERIERPPAIVGEGRARRLSRVAGVAGGGDRREIGGTLQPPAIIMDGADIDGDGGKADHDGHDDGGDDRDGTVLRPQQRSEPMPEVHSITSDADNRGPLNDGRGHRNDAARHLQR